MVKVWAAKVFLGVICITCCSESFAKTLDVTEFGAKPGSESGTAINRAIQTANVGDVVFIGKGEWILSDKPIQAKSGVTVKGASLTETIIKHNSTAVEHPFFLIEGTSNFAVSDLTLEGNNNSLCTHGIDGGNVTNITISNVRVQNLVQSSEFGTFGVFFNGNAQQCTVKSCVFENIGVRSKWGAAIQVSQLPNVPSSGSILSLIHI